MSDTSVKKHIWQKGFTTGVEMAIDRACGGWNDAIKKGLDADGIFDCILERLADLKRESKNKEYHITKSEGENNGQREG